MADDVLNNSSRSRRACCYVSCEINPIFSVNSRQAREESESHEMAKGVVNAPASDTEPAAPSLFDNDDSGDASTGHLHVQCECPSCRLASCSGIGKGRAQSNFNISTDQESLVRHFIDRQKSTDVGQAVVIEWRQVAAVVDRILFWVFCVMTSVSSALFLLIIPGYNRGWFTPKSDH